MFEHGTKPSNNIGRATIVVNDRVQEFSCAFDVGIAGIELTFDELRIEPNST